jgi:preprotein translocase subunit SecE
VVFLTLVVVALSLVLAAYLGGIDYLFYSALCVVIQCV